MILMDDPLIEEILMGEDRTSKLLADALSGVGGPKPEDPKPKKGRRKKSEGLIDMSQVKGDVRPTDVAKWKDFHFYEYASEQCQSLFGVGFPARKSAGTMLVREIRRRLKEATSQDCDPVTLKAYVEWFVGTQMKDAFADARDKYGLNVLKSPSAIRKFASAAARLVPDDDHDDLFDPPVVAGIEEDVAAKAQVGLQAVLLEYGIVVTVNYLIKKGVAPLRATKMVSDVGVKAVRADKRNWDGVVAATERHGPYPKALAWADADDLTDAVEAEAGVKLKRSKVKLCDKNDSLGFLTK